MSEEHVDLGGTSASCAKYTACIRTMPLRRDGTIHVHGPVRHQCAGSGEAPSSVGLVNAVAVTATAAVCHALP